jgi:hypothetical protein
VILVSVREAIWNSTVCSATPTEQQVNTLDAASPESTSWSQHLERIKHHFLPECDGANVFDRTKRPATTLTLLNDLQPAARNPTVQPGKPDPKARPHLQLLLVVQYGTTGAPDEIELLFHQPRRERIHVFCFECHLKTAVRESPDGCTHCSEQSGVDVRIAVSSLVWMYALQ